MNQHSTRLANIKEILGRGGGRRGLQVYVPGMLPPAGNSVFLLSSVADKPAPFWESETFSLTTCPTVARPHRRMKKERLPVPKQRQCPLGLCAIFPLTRTRFDSLLGGHVFFASFSRMLVSPLSPCQGPPPTALQGLPPPACHGSPPPTCQVSPPHPVQGSASKPSLRHLVCPRV
jgi:hypothetical protein